MSDDLSTGAFTLPGEAGYEDLTLELAEKWGATSSETVMDSALRQILSTGFDIYSTLCLVRADNEWAKAHPDKLNKLFDELPRCRARQRRQQDL